MAAALGPDAMVAPPAVPPVVPARPDALGRPLVTRPPLLADAPWTAEGARARSDARLGAPGSAAGVAAPVADAPRDPASTRRRFLDELGGGGAAAPVELPARWAPIAASIAPARRIRVSTDEASRRALRAVGKEAATTGDVIHLRDPLGTVRPEVIAHELTHAAHPSPTPRFFADDDHGPEERLATRIGQMMRSSPVAPSLAAPLATQATRPLPPVPTSTPSVPSPGPGGSTGTVSAANLAASLTGGTRTATTAPNAAPLGVPSPASASGGSPSGSSGGGGTSSSADAGGGSPLADDIVAVLRRSTDASDWVVEQVRANFDRVVEELERRVLREIERRGGRFRGAL
jgi:hypothetical protein